MAEWRTFNRATSCGGCGSTIPPGAWCVLFADGRLTRCEGCGRKLSAHPPSDAPPTPAEEVSDYGKRLGAALSRRDDREGWGRIDGSAYVESLRPEPEPEPKPLHLVERDPFDGIA